MKKLVLTMTIASLALSANAFAAARTGKDAKDSTKTESERKEESRKQQEAKSSGVSARSSEIKALAKQLVARTGIYSGSDAKLISDRIATAVENGIIPPLDLQFLEGVLRENFNGNTVQVAQQNVYMLTGKALKNELTKEDLAQISKSVGMDMQEFREFYSEQVNLHEKEMIRLKNGGVPPREYSPSRVYDGPHRGASWGG